MLSCKGAFRCLGDIQRSSAKRAVELANQRDENGDQLVSFAQLSKDLGISDSCLRGWVGQAEIDSGRRPGLSSKEREELVGFRRRAQRPSKIVENGELFTYVHDKLQQRWSYVTSDHYSSFSQLPNWSTP